MSSKTLRSELDLDEQTGVDYWRLFRDLPDPYLLFEASEPDYRIVETSKARDAITGVNREDCIGRPLFETFPFTDKQIVGAVGKDLRTQLRQVIRTGRSVQLDPIHAKLRDSHGVKRLIYVQITYFPIRDASGRVRYILAATRIVTDELHAMERIAAAESRLAAALTIGKVGSWVYDPATANIAGDDNFRKLFRVSARRADSYSLKQFLHSVHQDDRSRVTTAIKHSLKQRTPLEIECRVIFQDGTQHWILARGQREGGKADDGPELISGVVVDLTEQRSLRAQVELARQQDVLNQQAARVLQERNEELEAISRSKDEFVALASHQLRTPATAVKQYIGMVLQGYVGSINDEQVDVLTNAFESNERQIQIINQILSAARADTGRLVIMPMPVDMCSLLRSVIADMGPSFKQRQQALAVHLPSKPVRVSADLGYLRMAVENVLHNACVYTPVGGTVTLQLRATTKNCQLIIADTGVGIKKADLGKLFVKFSRIHNPLSVEAGGSGIGLYLTAEIIRLHNGEIHVESEVNKGSTFAISLPLMQNKDKAKRGS